jgi:hypothetical protein
VNALKRALAAAADWLRIPVPACCPHLELDDDPDTAYLLPDTTHNDYRGNVTNG